MLSIVLSENPVQIKTFLRVNHRELSMELLIIVRFVKKFNFNWNFRGS